MRAPKGIAICSNNGRHQETSRPPITRHTPFAALPQFLSVEEFRAFVGIGRSTVYDLLRRDALPCVRFGRVVRIPRDALRPYLRLDESEKEK